MSGQPAVPDGGIVLCSETLIREACTFCEQVSGHKPLCVINLRQLRSMAANISLDLAKLARRQERLAEGLIEVHRAALAELPPRQGDTG
ncbi:MAG TPA: hypothetical protein VGI66_17915 [Streptosporangiaceae bacterium]